VDSDAEFSGRIAALLQDLCDMRDGKRPFTMILTDPLSHSFFSNPFHPSPDTRLEIVFRPRTFEENEELGLNDINTENYKQKKEEVKKEEAVSASGAKEETVSEAK
jgi:zinc finger protein